MDNHILEIKAFRKVLFLLLISAALVGLIFFGLFLKSRNVSADNQREQLQYRLSQIKGEISNYQKQINQTRSQAASLKNEISIFDNQIKSIELQIEANNTQREDTTLQINELEIQIDKMQSEIEDNKKILAQLVVQLSKLDENSFLQIGLGTDDFSSFLDQIQYVRSINDQVYSLVTRIKGIKTKLETQQQDLKISLEKLESLKEQLEVSQSALDEQRANKEQLLVQTKGVESNYQKLLTQTKGEQTNIQNEIDELEGKARSGGNKSIAASKGVLAWPMEGTLTQGFGKTGFTALGYNSHNGIDIAAPPGQPIYSAADGTVAHCGSNDEAAYGNWCTVKHYIDTKTGQRCVVTLYAHMRSYKVAAGSKVARGDLIGYQGNTGNTTRLIYGPSRGYHLHFSVFDCDGYTVTPGKYSNIYGAYSVPSGYIYNPLLFLNE
jgi:murein DD-endopeptidase MepM/ murein hydrolase activator NlpD